MSSLVQNKETIRYKISSISILSFALSLFSFALIFFSMMNSAFDIISNESIKLILGIALISVMFTSFVLAIIDICKKNRKKILSFISLVVGGGFLFIIILLILTLYTA